jgi:hypothetical protein
MSRKPKEDHMPAPSHNQLICLLRQHGHEREANYLARVSWADARFYQERADRHLVVSQRYCVAKLVEALRDDMGAQDALRYSEGEV